MSNGTIHILRKKFILEAIKKILSLMMKEK